jgi:putative peptidoglycan lipid II flippase
VDPPRPPAPEAGEESELTDAGGDRSLSRNTAVMAAGTTLSRLTGFGRVFALAYALGLTRTTDAYNLANTTPNIVYELVVGGVLSATLLPVFVRLHATEDDDEAWRGTSAVVTTVLVAVAVLSLLLLVAAPLFIRLYTLAASGEAADHQRAVATTLLRYFAPQVALYGMITVATALLHARRRFAVPMFAPVLNNLVVIGVLLALPHVVDNLSIEALRHDAGALAFLGLGTTAGVAAMALPQVAAVLRHHRRRLRLHWEPRHPAVTTVLRLSAWTFGFTIANQIAYWVVLVLANREPGDLSAYQAAYQYFFLLPHGIIAVSVMSALQPDLAERWSLADVGAFRERLSTGLRSIIVTLVPAAVGYVVLARPIVRMLLEHGAMSAGDARTVADVLAVMAVGLPAFSAYLLLMRAFQAMQDTRTVFLLYLGENAVNIGLALALYPACGVQGLAAAFAAAYVAGTVMALAAMRGRTAGIDGRAIARTGARVAAASAVMAVVAGAASLLVGGDSGARLVARVGVGVVAGVTVYVAVARALGVGELTALLRIGTRRGQPG